MTADFRKSITIWLGQASQMQHSHVRHFHPAKGTTEGSQDCLAELMLKTFAKGPVSLNPTAMTAHIYPRANTITVLLQWGDAARKGVEKSGRSSQRPQSPWEGPGLPPEPSAHTLELLPIQKKNVYGFLLLKNRHLLSTYVNFFKRGKDVQTWWLIFAFISKSIRLILKVQKSFLHIWFIMCSVSRVYETLS